MVRSNTVLCSLGEVTSDTFLMSCSPSPSAPHFRTTVNSTKLQPITQESPRIKFGNLRASPRHTECSTAPQFGWLYWSVRPPLTYTLLLSSSSSSLLPLPLLTSIRQTFENRDKPLDHNVFWSYDPPLGRPIVAQAQPCQSREQHRPRPGCRDSHRRSNDVGNRRSLLQPRYHEARAGLG